MSIMDFLKKNSTSVYDPSENSISVAGLKLDSVTNIDIKYEDITKVVYGTHGSYTTVVKQTPKAAIITVSLLPVARCLLDLKRLSDHTKTVGGFFEIIVVKNKVIEAQGKSWITKIPDQAITQEGADVSYQFGINLYQSPTISSQNLGDFDPRFVAANAAQLV